VVPRHAAAARRAGEQGRRVGTEGGQQFLVDDDRLQLVTAPTASSLVQRLFAHLQRGKVLEPLGLPETVWLVLAIIILDQPITRARDHRPTHGP
jgi:chromosome segregation and condensation protein ScpB